ncbi:MAG: hypothetical protein AAFY83_05965 [Pseudomonadota bacterium]
MAAKIRLYTYFFFVAVLPGLTYHYVQDNKRDDAPSYSELVTYLLGIAPNALGGVSLTAGIIAIAYDWFAVRFARKGIIGLSAAIALTGLIGWEAAQLRIPTMTFDWQDVAWTFPGVGLAALLALFWVPHPPGHRTG